MDDTLPLLHGFSIACLSTITKQNKFQTMKKILTQKRNWICSRQCKTPDSVNRILTLGGERLTKNKRRIVDELANASPCRNSIRFDYLETDSRTEKIVQK